MKYFVISFFLICLFINISYSEVLKKSNNNNNNLLPGIINHNNLDKDEITIIGTADGFIHAVDSNNKKVWSTSTGGPLSKHHSSGNLDYTVIPSSDGSLLIHNTEGGMRKTSVKTKMLAEKSSLMTQDGLIITGHKTSKIFSLDIGSGDVLHDSSDIKKSNNTGRSVVSGSLQNNLKSIQDGLNSFSKSTKVLKNKPMWLGRTDYILKAYDGITGLEEFNISFSEIHPISSNRFDTDGHGDNYDINNQFSKNEDYKEDKNSNKLLTLNKPNNGRISRSQLKQISTPEGDLFHYDESGHIQHTVSLGVPIVSVFTVGNINKVHQEYNKNDGKLKHRNSLEYDIRTSPISFRMADALRYTSPIDDDNEESVILVRSLDDGGLYALELPIPTAPLDQQLYAIEPPHLSLATKEDDIWAFNNQDDDNEFEDYTEIDERNLVAIVNSNDYNENNDDEYIKDEEGINNKDRNRIDGYYALPWNERKVSKDKNTKERNLEKIRLQLDNSYIDLQDFNIDDDVVNNDLFQEYKTSTNNSLDNDNFKLNLLHFFGVLVITLLLIIIYLFVIRINNNKIEIIDDNNISNRAINNQIAEIDNNINNNEIVKYDEDGKKMIIIGSLTIFPSIVLGYGSHGTVVFRGCLNGRPIAVKRMLSQFNHEAAEREISVLIRSDGHSNVVRYYLREIKGEFVYLALQLCKMSLKDFVLQLQKSIISNKYSNKLDKESNNINSINKSMDVSKAMDGIEKISDIVRKALLQIAKGVAHLHSQRIVHRDIKPHNILCALPDDSINNNELESSITHHNELGDYILKISDMGLSKQLNSEEGSFGSISMSLPQQVKDVSSNSSSGENTADNGPVGTIGWQAPELMALRGTPNLINDNLEDNNIKRSNKNNDDDLDDEDLSSTIERIKSMESEDDFINKDTKNQLRRRTQNVDIFSLGCVFHYVLVPGEHPFGLWYEREANIMTGKANLTRLSQHNDAMHLINLMIKTNPFDRPSAKQVCNHPFFWPSSKRLEFLVDLSDKIEHEAIDSPIIQALEKNSQLIVGNGWDKCLFVPLIEDLNKYRKYDMSSIRDLLRVIRNKKHHYNELSQHVKDTIGDLPTGFIQYFEIKFPNLFMHAVEISCQYLSTDKDLLIYCKSICTLFNCNDDNLFFKDNINVVDLKSDDLLSKTLSNSSNNSSKSSSNNNSTKSIISISKSNDTDGDIICHGSAETLNRGSGWWQTEEVWETTKTFNKALKTKSSRLIRASTDFKYRSRLCSHWDLSNGTNCPMKKKGKCDFAHGALELRVKENRRNKWGKINEGNIMNNEISLSISGGEDVFNIARKDMKK